MFSRILKYLQKRCKHPASQVNADILEGGNQDYKGIGFAIQWCRVCGSIRFVVTGEEKTKAAVGWERPQW